MWPLTSERDLGILVHVVPQLVVVHVLSGGERGGDGRVDAAQVQSLGARRGSRQAPRCGPRSSDQRLHGCGTPAEQHCDAARARLSSPRKQLPCKPRRVNQQRALVNINLVPGPRLSLKFDRFALQLMCFQFGRKTVQPTNKQLQLWPRCLQVSRQTWSTPCRWQGLIASGESEHAVCIFTFLSFSECVFFSKKSYFYNISILYDFLYLF